MMDTIWPRDHWIIIENDVWIGMNCIILKGVTIGSGSVSAGSVVIKNVDPIRFMLEIPLKKLKIWQIKFNNKISIFYNHKFLKMKKKS